MFYTILQFMGQIMWHSAATSSIVGLKLDLAASNYDYGHGQKTYPLPCSALFYFSLFLTASFFIVVV